MNRTAPRWSTLRELVGVALPPPHRQPPDGLLSTPHRHRGDAVDIKITTKPPQI
jgi:hypothetical protein